MKNIPEIETQPIQKIRDFQESKLHELITYLHNNSPFYNRLFKERKIQPHSVQSIDDLTKIPVTTKNDLQRSNWDFLCVSRNKVAEYTSTSGTLGLPVIIALTQSDIDRLAYNEFISFSCANGNSNEVYQLMLTLDRQFMAGIAYYQGIRKLGAGLIRVGPGLPSLQWESIQQLKPTTLVAVPSFLLKLIEYARANGIDPNSYSVKKVICIGENIRTPDFQAATITKKIISEWSIDLFGTYASTEMQTAFTECEHKQGGHHHPELLIVELLDENNNRVKPGESGEVTITTLGVEGMPLLRYKTGDIATFHYEPCKCGRTTLRVGPVLGRKQQMIKLRGTTLYPSGIFEILQQVEGVRDYAVEAFTNELDQDDIKIYLVSDNEHATSQVVKSIFQSKLRISPEVIFCTQQKIDALHSTGQTRKLVRFIDRR